MSYRALPEAEDIHYLRQLMKGENRTRMLQDIRRKLMEMNLLKSQQMGNITADECVRYVDKYPDLTNETPLMALFFILYLHVFALGLIGNVAILYLTLRNRHLQTVQNIFILNLAISDVLICLTSLPITPITTIYKTWFFSSPVCKLIPLVQGSSVFVSTFSLSAIALDRYNLVVRPHKHPLNARGASIVASCLWIVSVVVCMPYGWYMDVVEINGLCGEYCTEKWPLPEVRKGYALMVLLMQFLFPFATMAACYYSIFSRLRERAESKLKKLSERTQLLEHSTLNGLHNIHRDEDSPDAKTIGSFEVKQRLTVLAQQRRTTTILASMVLLFGFAWLPHNVITLIIEYDESFFHSESSDHTYIVSMLAHFMSMSINVVNPILYAWLNPSFKEIFLKTLRRRNRTNEILMHKDTIIRVAQSTTQERSF